MDRDFLKTKIAREIITLVASGVYTDGQKLPPERRLCKQFNVSRGTIRQSLANLEELSVVKIKAGSGAYVQKIKPKKLPRRVLPPNFNNVTLKDTIVARKAIELTAIELACDNITSKDFNKLEKLINNMEQAIESLPDFLKYDMYFHESIIRASGNAALITAFEAIYEYHRYSQVFSSSSARCEDVAMVYHKKILQALKQKNKKKCVKFLNEHFNNMLI